MTAETTTEATPKAKKPKAAKKATAKKAVPTKKTEAKAPRGATYEVTKAGAKRDAKELGPQEGLLYGIFLKKAPVTVAAIAEAAEGKLTTNQEVKRVAAFYMTGWVREGFAKAIA